MYPVRSALSFLRVTTECCVVVSLPAQFIQVKHCLGLEKFLQTKIYFFKLNDQCCLCYVIHIQNEYLLIPILDGLTFKISLIAAALPCLRTVLHW